MNMTAAHLFFYPPYIKNRATKGLGTLSSLTSNLSVLISFGEIYRCHFCFLSMISVIFILVCPTWWPPKLLTRPSLSAYQLINSGRQWNKTWSASGHNYHIARLCSPTKHKGRWQNPTGIYGRKCPSVSCPPILRYSTCRFEFHAASANSSLMINWPGFLKPCCPKKEAGWPRGQRGE